MIEFNDIWQLLLENGASARKEEGTRRFWNTITPEQQHAAFTSITSKMATRNFVHFDPIRAIKENMWSAKEPQPYFLSGQEQDRLREQGIPLVQVKYNGLFKICTRETMELFNLEHVRDW